MASQTQMSFMDAEPQPRSSIESRRSAMSRMSRMTQGTLDIRPDIPTEPPSLPETKLDLSLSLDQIFDNTPFAKPDPVEAKKREHLEKRQSNVLRLAEENEKLNAELKAMSERLAAAERRTAAILEARERKAKEQQAQMQSVQGMRLG